MRGTAFAKLNLSLRVRSVGEHGLHPLVSLAQSVDWSDSLILERADRDAFDADGPVPQAPENLAWRAVEVVRGPAGRSVRVSLHKEIPVAAGLAGGSADAALALALAAGVLGLSVERAVAVAPELGADVPFCLAGGTAWMEGVGDRVTRIATPDDFWLGIVVPPFELSTAAVYRRWDELDGPVDEGVAGRTLPVSLREHAPLGNDLAPAARHLSPELGDWMSEVAGSWGQPVLMSGSGPALFGFFASAAEAADAVGGIAGARAARACAPMPVGWEIADPGDLPPAPWM